MSRLEGFSDAAFAFALTLLVVSLEVPRTFDQLMDSMRGFGAFAICFLFLIGIWYRHYLFFRRYGLQDLRTIILNSLLLFVVLFYIYPLKFLFTLVVDGWFGIDTSFHLPNGAIVPAIQNAQQPVLMVIYGAGFVAVESLFALLYRHAWVEREALALNELEGLETRESVEGHFLNVAMGCVSIMLATVAGGKFLPISWYPYPAIGLVRWIHGWWRGRMKGRIVRSQKETE